MILKRIFLFYFISIFFIIANLYWFPFVSSQLISDFKIIMLSGIVVLYLIFFFMKKNYYNNDDIFIIFCLIIAIFYNLISSVNDLKYIIMFTSFVIFYFFGKSMSFLYLSNKVLLLTSILFLWVFLSLFFPTLNYKNQLWLDYEFSEVMLSSSGFSIARTSWGIGVALLTLYLLNFARSSKFKKLLFVSAFLCVLSTGSRGGMIYFCLALCVFITMWEVSWRSKFLTFLVTLGLFLTIFIYFGKYLRLSGVEDITTGRSSQYVYFLELFKNNYLFGYYSSGGYSLTNYGFEYNQIHNAWLNFILNYGLIGFSPLFLFLFISLRKVIINFEKINYNLYLVLLCGLFSTLLEPDTIFSNGYHVLIFWFTLGFLSRSRNFL